MARWQRIVLLAVGIGILAVWPARWAVQGLPESFLAVEGGGAWPVHLAAEATVAALLLWAASGARPAALLALGTVIYGSINGLSYGIYGSAWHMGIVVAKLAAAVALSGALLRTRTPSREARSRWPGAVIALVGAGMIAFWALQSTVGGMMKDGPLTVEGSGYLLFHMIAEDTAGSIALLAGLGVLVRLRYAVRPALVGAGAVLYAALNSLGWAVLNDAALGVIFVVCSLAMVLSAAGLWKAASADASAGRRAA